MRQGWDLLLGEAEASREARARPVRAYSEFMPPPRVAWKPCGEPEPGPHVLDDPGGWYVSEYEESEELAPGLQRIAHHITTELLNLVRGAPSQLSRRLLDGNPAWTEELARSQRGEQGCLVALPLALSRSQDDKGRVRWTMFGTSHDGPARAFWRSLRIGPSGGSESAAFRRFLSWAVGVPLDDLRDLRAAGLRVLPLEPDPQFPRWADEQLPDFLVGLRLGHDEPLESVRFVITFRPFSRLPGPLRAAYLRGAVRLIPSPASLVFFGESGYRTLARALPHAMQIPLLHLFERSERIYGIRIPQSGWLHETPVRMVDSQVPPHHVRRMHRFEHHGRRVDDVLAAGAVAEVRNDPVTIALFSTEPDVLGLYNKPMARNAQIWTEEYHLLLNGPLASKADIAAAAKARVSVGRYGYRFLFPPMLVGEREVFWHRPLVARIGEDGRVERCPEALLGYVTAERTGETPIELQARALDRPGHRDTAELFEDAPVHRRLTRRNVRKVLEWSELVGGTLSPSLARSLISVGRKRTLDEWLVDLPNVAKDPARAAAVVALVRSRLGPEPPVDPAAAVTYDQTHRREFEQAYWSAIRDLSDGRFAMSNSADVVSPEAGGPALQALGAPPRRRQLEELRDYLHRYYRGLFERFGMDGKAVCADQVFRWETDFDFDWWGGWRRDRAGEGSERNVVVVIPGRDRSEAVVMGDHVDTAYMEDVYDPAKGGDGRRVAATGADDNHSATAALTMAAQALLPLARQGRLERDVWLVHLTGEEFPADCMGSRALVERLIARDLALTAEDGAVMDMSATRVVAAFILDMVAHNNDREHNVFQISPGDGAASARLAQLVHLAKERWNAAAAGWNQAADRHGQGRGRRVLAGEPMPPIAEHPSMTGQTRPEWDPHSTLYNTDGQIYSDAGVPVVLLMEDYDLNRRGYHDSADTMANIDLDYGSALVAIAIESVAQAAGARPAVPAPPG